MFRWFRWRKPGEVDESPQHESAGDGGSSRNIEPEDAERRDKLPLIIEILRFVTAVVRAFSD
ncbi:hypothetical protein [Kitasatospora sp. NPDC056531]|uniref:hypothetical protein n=1 Tax=Kitasatospora sp. NPDC056531 TaxID=3345856 RepID=UPI0036898F5C